MANKQFSIDLTNCGFVDPQLQLGRALATADLNDFRAALSMGANASLQDDGNASVFEKALRTYGCAEFVKECLRHGCNANYENPVLHKAAINFAADSRDAHILNALLEHSRNIDVNRKHAELTPLNSLAKNLQADNAHDVTACIKLLLAYGASPNIPDQRQMTPLNHILKNRQIDEQSRRELTHLFLAQPNLDLDSYRDGEVRQLLGDKYPDLQLPAPLKPLEINFDTLLSSLRSGDEREFLNQFSAHRLSNSDRDNHVNATQEQNLQLFLETIKRGAHKAFAALLRTGLDANQVHNGNTAIEIAAIWGNWYALRELLQLEELRLRPQDQPLLTVIRKLDEQPLHDFCDYNKCFKVLLDSKRVDINDTDASGSTPLHYAVKYRNHVAIKELLSRGAYIGMRSAFNDLSIDGIQPDLLEEHFDSCISTNGLKPGDESYEILMNFKNFMPHQTHEHGVDIIKQQHNFQEEMTPIAFIAESKEHRYLLQHPLITSFLFLKWHRLSVIFYVNFLIYVLFAVSIVTHTILKFRESEHATVTTIFGILSWIGIVYLIVREVIQFIMSPITYFRSPINLMEIALIVLAIMTCSESSYDRETQRVVAVFTMLLVALELCLLVGSLPVLSISTHMLMLRAVSNSFLKSFTLYSIFVITFSLCFYILFGKPEVTNDNENSTNATATKENGDFNKFSSPIAALIKTIVMLTGEFDAGDINFDTLYSYLIFLLFVFFMSIVLFNLLNGLAVSDTQAIKAQAELNGSICRANLLTRYEAVLTGRSGSATFIINHEPFRSICRRLMSLHPGYIRGSQIAILPNEGNKVMIPLSNAYALKEIATNNAKSTFLSAADSDNECEKKLLDPPVSFLPCCCACVTERCSQMDVRTVKLAMTVLDKKNSAVIKQKQLQDTERRLEQMEFKLDQIFALLQGIQTK